MMRGWDIGILRDRLGNGLTKGLLNLDLDVGGI